MDHEEAARIQATEKYLLGSLSSPARDAFEEHFFDCEICAEDVRAAVYLLDNASAEFKAESAAAVAPVPQRTRQRSWRDWFHLDLRLPAFALPALALPALALIVVSALWVGDHRRLAEELNVASAPQLITNVPLENARGEQSVGVVKDERYFAVSFYINPDKQPTYAIQISGNDVPTATVLATARANAYSILLPVARYKPGHYDFKVFAGKIDGPLVKQFALTLE